ncbi:type II toxin-antitoxin system RelE/ParE family toxin [Pseudomonas capsici]|uniref:type II toxin-antitoxin system RelE/ParE family toxin n=1 Tax=Pseudomonas capsici TaxID=2810614 RepID=UPI0021F22029|nr:type II toxin-antitoxin system RelE/ParE family toxin [Pseudomonas capsici]MCV4262994.1 type II toxin-antitoxin system RelE/ParE family toxin [Pseudomonas capsici]
MIFIETPIFTSDLKDHLNDEEYRALQQHLAQQPDAGNLIEDTGGLRKVRWGAHGKGKSGGARVIYYHLISASQIRMILIYHKGIMDTLTDKQKAQLRALNKGWK